MKVEHIGYQVEDPVKAAEWYVEHLGMKIVRTAGEPAHARFLADSDGMTVIEIYNNPKVKPPDYRTVDPLIIHLAFQTDQVEAERQRLIDAGAEPYGEVDHLENGDILAIVRDPWGFPVQLAKRGEPMV